MASYPAKEFLHEFTGEKSALLSSVDKTNKAGERPGKQHALDVQPIDDVLANGKPYQGSGKLQGKSAWVSGGDSGIGRATAILFAIEGADVAINYLPSEQKDAESTRDYIKKKTGRDITLLPADLRTEKACVDNIEDAAKALGNKLDILVNNAAQQLENHDVTTLPGKQWEETFNLNIHSYFHCSKAAIKYMAPGSSIINMASINAFVGRPDLLDYTSTKGAIISFTRGLSNQIVGEKQIRVNAVAPGPIFTPLVVSTFTKDNVSGFDGTPMKRPGQPVEVATCCVFLASEDSSFISGNVLHPNGGTVIH